MEAQCREESVPGGRKIRKLQRQRGKGMLELRCERVYRSSSWGRNQCRQRCQGGQRPRHTLRGRVSSVATGAQLDVLHRLFPFNCHSCPMRKLRFLDLGWGLIICIFNKFHGDADIAGVRTARSQTGGQVSKSAESLYLGGLIWSLNSDVHSALNMGAQLHCEYSVPYP